jgi:uncharacterized protein (DUF1501 family)
MSDPVLVVIFLRGGADALNLVSPTGDADYIAARPADMRVARSGDEAGTALPEALADVDFRLHPRATELGSLFKAGDLSILHATGLLDVTRSHFDAEMRIERGATGADGSGWLGRTLAQLGTTGPLPALAVGTAMPGSLRGSRAAVAPALSDLTLAPGHWLAPALAARLEAGFGRHPTLGATTTDLLALSQTLTDRLWQPDSWDFRAYAPAVPYPSDTELSGALMTVAQTIKEDLGLRIATVDYGGWDTHAHQRGDFDRLVSGLSRAMMAFWRDLGPRQQDVCVVVQSEFGRRLRSNESGGTDHGRAGAMMVLGPQAQGGRLLGRWPGLSNQSLDEGADLAVTTDYRDVLADVLGGHMRVADPTAVFPGLRHQGTGLYG